MFTQNHNLLVANKFFSNVTKFKCLVQTLRNYENVKSRSNSWNSCYYPFQNPLPLYLLSKTLKSETSRLILLKLSDCDFN